jgi:hypothetical protein
MPPSSTTNGPGGSGVAVSPAAWRLGHAERANLRFHLVLAAARSGYPEAQPNPGRRSGRR